VEKSTGKSHTITITNDKGRLNKDEIERLVKEAETYAEEDKKGAERVEAKNQLETYLYNTRNAIQEEKVKETLGAPTVKEVGEWVTEGIAWLEEHPEDAKEEYEAKKKEVEDKIRPVMMKLYQESGVGETSQGEAGQSKAGPGPAVEEVD